MPRYWTKEEEATLREMWVSVGTLKEQAHKLPRRSVEAMEAHAIKIGLRGSRAHLWGSRQSWVEQEINRALKAGIFTAKQLAEKTHCAVSRIQQILTDGHRTKYHIGGWTRSSTRGNFEAKWGLGCEEDVARPKAKTSAQTTREWRARQALKRQTDNPFAVSMQSVCGSRLVRCEEVEA